MKAKFFMSLSLFLYLASHFFQIGGFIILITLLLERLKVSCSFFLKSDLLLTEAFPLSLENFLKALSLSLFATPLLIEFILLLESGQLILHEADGRKTLGFFQNSEFFEAGCLLREAADLLSAFSILYSLIIFIFCGFPISF